MVDGWLVRLYGLIALLSEAAADADNSTLRVIVLQRMSDARFPSEESCGPSWADGHCWLDSGWQAVAVTALAAAADFNARNGTFAPALASEQMAACDKQMEITMLDSESTGQMALEALFGSGLFTDPPHVVIGAALSAVNSVTAVPTGALEIPQISYWSTSPKLSDKELYPRFMRTIPDDTIIAQAMCELVQGFGYDFLAVIAIDDTWGQGLSDALTKSCTPRGVEVLVYHYDSESVDSIDDSVRAASRMDQDIVFVLSVSPQECDAIVTTALDTGLLGKGKTQWMFSESCIGNARLLNDDAIAALDGSFQIQAVGASETNPRWMAFAESFAARHPAEYNAWLPASWQMGDDFFASINPHESYEMRNVATFEYDAIVAAGLLACSIAPTGPLPADGFVGPAVWEAKDTLEFTGLSGTVSFDAEGDRNVSSANVQLFNVIEVGAHVRRNGTIGTASTPAHMTLDLSSINTSALTMGHHKFPIGEFKGGEWDYFDDAEIVYAGGRQYPPRKLHVSLLQRMSDVRYPTAESCGASFVDGTCWLSEGWQAILVAALKAIADFNNREGAFAPLLAGEEMAQCDKQISYSLLDSGSTGPTSVLASTSTMYSWPVPNVIIGPARSTSSQASATVLGVADIPQISYWATSTDLDDTRLYPRFMRTIPTDLAPATSICKLWAVDLGLRQAAILFTSDSFGTAYRDGALAACDAFGVNVFDFEFEAASPTSMAHAVAQLAETRVEVVLCISIGAQDTAVIVAEALELGLMGVGSSWAFTDGLSAGDVNAIVEQLGEEAQAALHGSLQIRAVGATDDNPRWAAFADEWWPNQQPSDFNPELPKDWQLSDDFFSTFSPRTSGELMHIGTFEYDAIVAAGIYACRIIPQGPLPLDFGTRFWEFKQNMTVEGLTGVVGFDEVGNRDIATATVQLFNLLPGADGFETSVVAQFNNDAWTWVGGDRVASGVVFNRNDSTPPTDPPEEQDEMTDSMFEKMRERVIIGTTVGFALIVVCVTVFGRRAYLRYKALREGTMRYVDDDSECIPHMEHPPQVPYFNQRSSRFGSDAEAAIFIQHIFHKWRDGEGEKQALQDAAKVIQRIYRGRASRKLTMKEMLDSGLGKSVKHLRAGSVRAAAQLEASAKHMLGEMGSSSKYMLQRISDASDAIGARSSPGAHRGTIQSRRPSFVAKPVIELPELGTEERRLLELAATCVQHKWRAYASWMKAHGRTPGSRTKKSPLVVEAISDIEKNLAKSHSNLMQKISLKKSKYLAIQHSEELDYDLFLSHVWGSGGGQEKMRLLKVKLKEMMPSLRIFLDVDDLKEGRGMEGVDSTHVILTFLTQGYFLSPNCMREMLRAVTTGKPIIVMGTQDKGGGIPINEVKKKLEVAVNRLTAWGLDKEVKQWGYEVPTADQLHEALFAHPTVEFDPIAPFQMVWFRKIAEMLLVKGHSPCYVRGEMTIQSLQQEQHHHKKRHNQKQKPVLHPPRNGCKYHLYCSPFNVGAARLCHEFERFLQLAEPTSTLLYAGHRIQTKEAQPDATIEANSSARVHRSSSVTSVGSYFGAPAAHAASLHRSSSLPAFMKFPVGTRVHHPSHGAGVVTETAGDGGVRIKFDNGESHKYKPSSMYKVSALQDDELASSVEDDNLKTYSMASTSDLLECEMMLLYLTADTWTSGVLSKKLGDEVRSAMMVGVKIFLVHEAPSWDSKTTNACPFENFFACEQGTTPQRLLHAGIYRPIANALRAEPLRTASFVMLVKSLGAADNFVRKPNEMLRANQLQVVARMASFVHEQKAEEELHELAQRSKARGPTSSIPGKRERLWGRSHTIHLRPSRHSNAPSSDDVAEGPTGRSPMVHLTTPTATRTINASIADSSAKSSPKREMTCHRC